MPSKSTSKSAKTSTAKSPKQSKSKISKSSEYVADSDLDNDEPMTDAPPAKKATLKATENTSKKRNRDGTEKVNGAGSSSSKKGRESALVPEPKSSKDKKKSKKIVEVVEVSSEEESVAEDESSDKEEEDESEESESESETSEPARTSKSTQFKLPLDKDVPPGFTPLESTSAGSISSSLKGKQIFLFTAPSNFKFSDVKKIKLQSGPEGETIQSGDMKFSIRRSAEPVSSSMKVMVPKEGKKGYQLASVSPAAQYVITEMPPSGRIKIGEQGLPLPPRAQPEGLRMRFMPAGYGEESDYNINEAVLPRKDLVADGDYDVIMGDAESIASTPKKSKKKKSKDVEEVEIIEEALPEVVEAEKKKSKKEKKEKKEKKDKSGKEGEGKKEKKSKHNEDSKKEKKKHKKDKAEA